MGQRPRETRHRLQKWSGGGHPESPRSRLGHVCMKRCPPGTSGRAAVAGVFPGAHRVSPPRAAQRQTPGSWRKAAVQRKPHCLYKQNGQRGALLSENGGNLPQTQVPGGHLRANVVSKPLKGQRTGLLGSRSSEELLCSKPCRTPHHTQNKSQGP